MLSIEEVKAKAMEELNQVIKPAKDFKAFVKNALLNGVDTIDTSQIENWLFSIPLLYGELRGIEVDYKLSVDYLDAQIEKTKADIMAQNAGGKVTDARNLASQATNDLQVQQYVAKYMAGKINALWSELEMLIFSVRNVYEARNPKVHNDN